MKEVRILSIDERGRIVVPQIIRKSLGLITNAQLMLIADSESKEMKIIPIGLSDEYKPLKFKITIKDEAGSLGKIATAFGNHGISLVYGEAVIVEKGKTAIWTVIGPQPKELDLEKLKEILKKRGRRY